MKIIVMGCGRVGARLAQLFDHDGHEVAVVDLHTEPFTRLGPDFRGLTVAGTGIDEDVLRSLGIEHADLFLAVTNQDNANIMAAQIAKHTFHVPRVVARIYEPDREETYHQMGLETICPTTLIANRIYKAVATGVDAHIDPVEPAERVLPEPAPAAVGLAAVLAAPATAPANGGNADHSLPADADRATPHLGHALRQRFFR